MNDLERALVANLQIHVTFPPGSSHKRFIGQLSHYSQLSDGGRNYLAYIAHRYRRQWTGTPEQLEWVVRWKVYGDKKPKIAERPSKAAPAIQEKPDPPADDRQNKFDF